MRCEVQGCKANAQRMLRMPKVHVCEIHFLRNKRALHRMAAARYYFKKICGEYRLGIGIRNGKWHYLDARKKKETLNIRVGEIA